MGKRTIRETTGASPLSNIRTSDTYTLQPIGTQVLDLLVACVPHITDLAGLVALVQTDTQFVSETHGCLFSICKGRDERETRGISTCTLRLGSQGVYNNNGFGGLRDMTKAQFTWQTHSNDVTWPDGAQESHHSPPFGK